MCFTGSRHVFLRCWIRGCPSRLLEFERILSPVARNCTQRGIVGNDHRVIWNDYCFPTNDKRLRSRAGGFRYNDRRIKADRLELIKYVRWFLQQYRRILQGLRCGNIAWYEDSSESKPVRRNWFRPSSVIQPWMSGRVASREIPNAKELAVPSWPAKLNTNMLPYISSSVKPSWWCPV